MTKNEIRAVVIHEEDCPVEEWDGDAIGHVRWRTLISGDRTSTDQLTCGVAELPVSPSKTYRMHKHSPVEMYYILEGSGSIRVADEEYQVRKGSTVFIPGDESHCLINSGNIPLRLLYVFAADSFGDIEYQFPQSESGT